MKTFEQIYLTPRLKIGLDSTLLTPCYDMVLTIIKQIIKHMIGSITLNSIISKILGKYITIMIESKQEHNIKLATHQVNENSSNLHDQKYYDQIKNLA